MELPPRVSLRLLSVLPLVLSLFELRGHLIDSIKFKCPKKGLDRLVATSYLWVSPCFQAVASMLQGSSLWPMIGAKSSLCLLGSAISGLKTQGPEALSREPACPEATPRTGECKSECKLQSPRIYHTLVPLSKDSPLFECSFSLCVKSNQSRFKW